MAGGLNILDVEDDARAAAEAQDLAQRSGDNLTREASGARGLRRRYRTRPGVPLFTERYTIAVNNLGSGDARYFLVIQ